MNETYGPDFRLDFGNLLMVAAKGGDGIDRGVSTAYIEGPWTIVLVAGDADHGPPLIKVIEKGWRVEVVFEISSTGVSAALEPYVHEFRPVRATDF